MALSMGELVTAGALAGTFAAGVRKSCLDMLPMVGDSGLNLWPLTCSV